MTRSRLPLVALLLAAFAATACSNPTAPQPKQAKASLGVYGGSATFAPEPPKP
jgi:hypothetical protein